MSNKVTFSCVKAFAAFIAEIQAAGLAYNAMQVGDVFVVSITGH